MNWKPMHPGLDQEIGTIMKTEIINILHTPQYEASYAIIFFLTFL